MKTKVIGIIIVVFLGVFFGLIFNATQRTAILTEKLVAQQGEVIDLLRASEKQKNNAGLSKDVTTKIDDIHNILKRITTPPRQPQRPQENFDKVYNIPLDDSVIKGKADAPVTIVGFLDLQCPFSRRFEPVIDQVLKAYPDKVKYVVKNFPLSFHHNAIPAAKAALAAGEQGKYYEMVELILRNNNQLSDEKYQEFAKELKLNLKKFNNDLKAKDAEWTKKIQEEFALGQRVDVRGTPTFYLDGKKTKARSLQGFQKEIDAILSGSKK